MRAVNLIDTRRLEGTRRQTWQNATVPSEAPLNETMQASKRMSEWVTSSLLSWVLFRRQQATRLDSTRSSYIWQLSVGKHAQIQLDILTSPLHELSQLNTTLPKPLASLASNPVSIFIHPFIHSFILSFIHSTPCILLLFSNLICFKDPINSFLTSTPTQVPSSSSSSQLNSTQLFIISPSNSELVKTS